jgi:hypothetical protein
MFKMSNKPKNDNQMQTQYSSEQENKIKLDTQKNK